MLKLLVVVAVVVGAISAATDSEWAEFKAKHNKVYDDSRLAAVRRIIWEDNLNKIASHNHLYDAGLNTFTLAENEFADMTGEEFARTMNGLRVDATEVLANAEPVNEEALNSIPLASEVNWVTKGYVTGVKNQGQCGSGWAFSATGSLEGAHFKKTGILVSLSEQNLVDCSRSYGSYGCKGGLMDNAFRYIKANGGIDTEKSYSYEAEQGACRYNAENIGSTVSKYVDVTGGSEAALKVASESVGPISVVIDASHFSFQFYHSGVYSEPSCSSTRLDHGVLVVGYGQMYGVDYWRVKNSWGESWGLKGYMLMSRNKNNQCGIATKASYPIV